jgi:O-antigen ligase
MAVLLLAAFLQLILRVVRRRQRDNVSAAAPLAGAALVLALALAGIWYVAGDTIERRAALTEEQLSVMRAEGSIGSRLALYRDTWRMGCDRPWFGWGMASFPYAFMLYNTQEPNPRDRLPIFYSAAHNDWLESFAEHGVIGTLLLAGCALAPLFGLRRSQLASPLIRYLLAGCGLILAYAWVEFPFGNIAVVLSWWLCYFCAVRYAYLHAGAVPAPGG